MSKRILIVEDEQAIREMIRYGLEQAGFQVEEADSAHAAHLAMGEHRPDLLLIDWMMPLTSGLALTRELRKDPGYRQTPIIMVTARGEESDKIAGLEAGADDYIVKPLSMRELIARINALLRRSLGFTADEQLQVGPLTLDLSTHELRINGDILAISGIEYRLLAFLMAHPNRVYSRSQLLDHVWGPSTYIEERTVDVHILRLRKRLKPHQVEHMLQTVRSAGYRLVTPTQTPSPTASTPATTKYQHP